MIELPRGTRFLLEPAHPSGIGVDGIVNHLDGDVATKAWIAGAVHLAHTSGAEPANDLIESDARARGDVGAHATGPACVSVEAPPVAKNLISCDPIRM